MRMIKNLAVGICGKEGSNRYALEHLHITKHYVEATDGRMLIRLSTESDIKTDKCCHVNTIKALGNIFQFNEDKPIGVNVEGKYADVEFPETNKIFRDSFQSKTLVTVMNTSLLSKLLKALPNNVPIALYSKDKNSGITFVCEEFTGVILPIDNSRYPDKVEDLEIRKEIIGEEERKKEVKEEDNTSTAPDTGAEERVEEKDTQDVKKPVEKVERVYPQYF